MTESALNCPGIVTFIGEGIAAGVPEHVRMRLQFQASANSRALDHPGKARGRERRAAIRLCAGAPYRQGLWPFADRSVSFRPRPCRDPRDTRGDLGADGAKSP